MREMYEWLLQDRNQLPSYFRDLRLPLLGAASTALAGGPIYPGQ